MNDIFDLFTSKAKIIILRTLYYQSEPIHLRQIAYISELPIYSVQNALKQLLKDNVIKKRKNNNFLLFEINKSSAHYNFLSQFFFIEMKNRLSKEVKQYSFKVKRVLSFINSSIIFFHKVKKFKRKKYELNRVF